MYNGLDKPLFGEARPRDRYFNYVVGAVTVILVCETLISSLALHFPPKAINVFLASIISMICISELILIYWYRQGDVDPKFRKLIYFNSFTTILLCICANVYYHNTTA